MVPVTVGRPALGKSADGQGRVLPERLDHRKHLFRAYGAVSTDDAGSRFGQARCGLQGSTPIKVLPEAS